VHSGSRRTGPCSLLTPVEKEALPWCPGAEGLVNGLEIMAAKGPGLTTREDAQGSGSRSAHPRLSSARAMIRGERRKPLQSCRASGLLEPTFCERDCHSDRANQHAIVGSPPRSRFHTW